MDKVTQSFHLDYGPPGSLVKRPRLWRLTIGLLITASVAAAIPWISGLPSWWAATPDTGIRLSIGALGVGGIAIALHAVAGDGGIVEPDQCYGWRHLDFVLGTQS